MKLFCSNAFTGEDILVVSRRMQLVVDTLNGMEHEAYCPIFDPYKIELQAKGQTDAVFKYAFENISKCDGMIAILTSETKSEGQLMEIGAVLAASKPLFAFINTSLTERHSHIPKLANKVFMWSSEDELVEMLRQI